MTNPLGLVLSATGLIAPIVEKLRRGSRGDEKQSTSFGIRILDDEPENPVAEYGF